jgi:hypothetical protein
VVTKRIEARIGVGWAYTAGCLLFTAPLVLWPLAHGSRSMVLAMLFAAEFGSGFGVMVLDISIGASFAAVIPDTLRSRVTHAPGGGPAARWSTTGRCRTPRRNAPGHRPWPAGLPAGTGHGSRRCTVRRGPDWTASPPPPYGRPSRFQLHEISGVIRMYRPEPNWPGRSVSSAVP